MTRVLMLVFFLVGQSSGQSPHHYTIISVPVDEEDSAYTLSGSYPQVEGLPDTVQITCNTRIQFLIQGWVNSFKADARSAYEESDSNSMGGSYLDISYRVNLATDDLLSMDLGWSGMIAWNAHPASEPSTMTFNLRNGEDILLDDLFEPGTGFLDTLSRYCIDDILAQTNQTYADEQLLEGASPKADNFKDFSIDENSLIIIFDVYQVASYGNAPGGYIVEIPLKRLKSVLKKNGPINSLLK